MLATEPHDAAHLSTRSQRAMAKSQTQISLVLNTAQRGANTAPSWTRQVQERAANTAPRGASKPPAQLGYTVGSGEKRTRCLQIKNLITRKKSTAFVTRGMLSMSVCMNK